MGAPSLHDLVAQAAVFSESSETVAAAVVGTPVDYQDEYKLVAERIHMDAGETRANYPDYFAIEHGTAALLYSLVRHAKPELVLEMGVADGRSTQVILAAMDANGLGQLVSVDISDDVGGAAAGHPRWSLRIHAPQRSDRQLRALLSEIGSVDMFFHDAGHLFHEQLADYLAAWDRIRPGGFLISDDVGDTWAFLELARSASIRPHVLLDHRKVVGVLTRPA
jgi:predicted O-methyltransferase YrrM